jgi:autocrine motility factor receptor
LKNRNDDEEDNNEHIGNTTDRNGRENNNRGAANGGRTNHFFHFDGSRYASWLPSVSVEVTRPHLINIGVGAIASDQLESLGLSTRAALQSSQLDSMGRQVFEWFPHIPLNTIIEDLRITRSIEMTIENILDERVVAPVQSTSSRY